jgi:hypothetical protein
VAAAAMGRDRDARRHRGRGPRDGGRWLGALLTGFVIQALACGLTLAV